jgi:hypothetical protein
VSRTSNPSALGHHPGPGGIFHDLEATLTVRVLDVDTPEVGRGTLDAKEPLTPDAAVAVPATGSGTKLTSAEAAALRA